MAFRFTQGYRARFVFLAIFMASPRLHSTYMAKVNNLHRKIAVGKWSVSCR
jgi:hypothetical protein